MPALDQTVALEAFEGGVHLPDVDPGPRAPFVLRAQLRAVAGAAIEDREQAQTNGHDASWRV